MEDDTLYQIVKISEYLRSQKRISKVHCCEKDMWGNINQWMDTYIPRSQLLLIFFTEESKKSEACSKELKLAFKYDLTITPILGVGMNWKNFKEKSKEFGVDIANEFGLEYQFEDVEKFKKELYEYVMRVRKKIKEENKAKKKERKAKKRK